MTPFLIAPRGGPVDVCWHEGRIIVAYQDGPGPEARLVQRSYTPQGAVLSSVTYPLGSDVGAFPRLLSAHDAVWMIYREGKSLGGRAVLRRDGTEVWRSDGECGGNDPVCLGGDHFACQRAGDNAVMVGVLTAPIPLWIERIGAPTGISHLLMSGGVVLVDDARGAVSGVTRPSWAGDLVVGEHPDSGALVLAADGRRLRLWEGQDAYTPRLAYDALTGTYAAVTWGREGVRLATFVDADLMVAAPPPRPVWDATGATVDCGRFFDLMGSTVPREAEDGQCWQAHRVESRDDVYIVKGGDPRFVEILRLTDDDVRLAYDATDGKYPRAWRLDVRGDGRSDAHWCKAIGTIGYLTSFLHARLIRRTDSGPSTSEPFPYLVGVEAHGRNIDYGGDVGVVDAVLVTRFEPHAGQTADGYHELHHWCVVKGRAIGLVRYEEIRHGEVTRSFTFNRYAPGRSVPLSSLIVHPIPDPPDQPNPNPTPIPQPDPNPMPSMLPSHFALQHVSTGLYLAVEPSGAVAVDRPLAGLYETLTRREGDHGGVALLSRHMGKFLRARDPGERDGEAPPDLAIAATGDTVSTYESFFVVMLSADTVALLTFHGGVWQRSEAGGLVGRLGPLDQHAWRVVPMPAPPAPTPEPGEPSEPGAPVEPGEPSAVLPVVVDGRIMRDASGAAVDWREASAFMLLARWLGQNGGTEADVRARLDGWRQRRINVLRVFATIGDPGFWQSRGWHLTPRTPGLYAGMRRLTHVAGEYGIRLRWTFIADAPHTVPTDADQRAHVRACEEALRELPTVDEIANEPTMNGFGGEWAAQLASLARIVDPAAVVALGPEHGATGHLATADREPADVVFFHAERVVSEGGWAWVRRMGEYGVVRDGQRPVISGEPVNAGDEGAPGDYLRDPAIWFAYGAISRIVVSHGYAPTFHFHGGLWADLPNAATQRCLDAFHAGCDAVPLDVRSWAWTNGHHAESPWRGYDQTDPPADNRPVRIYGRRRGGVYIGVSLREPKGWRWTDLRYPVDREARVEGERFDCSVWRSI